MQLQKTAYHKKPTYDEMVKESITHPTDNIGLPDRQATQLRNTPQLTRYDDESFTDLNTDNQSILLEQLKQITLRQQASTHTTHTHTIHRAMNEDETMPQAPPPPPPPPASASKMFQSAGSQTAPKFQTTSSATQHSPPPMMRNSGQAGPPPPPPAAGGAAVPIDSVLQSHLDMVYKSAKAQQDSNERNHAMTREMMNRSMQTHLGPQATNNYYNQNFVTQVMQGQATSSAPPPPTANDVMMQSGGSSHPKPPPGGAGVRVTDSTVGQPRKPERYTLNSPEPVLRRKPDRSRSTERESNTRNPKQSRHRR